MSGVINQPTSLRADTKCLIQLSTCAEVMGIISDFYNIIRMVKQGICFKALLCDPLCSDEWPTLENFLSREDEAGVFLETMQNGA